MPGWLDRLSVAAPCSARWDEMRGDGALRFCASCGKDVYDLSALSRAEAESLVARAGEGMCARFERRADGTLRTRGDAQTGPGARAGTLRRQLVGLGAALALELFAAAADADTTTPARKKGRARAPGPAPRSERAERVFAIDEELPEHLPTAPPGPSTEPVTMGAINLHTIRPPVERIKACYEQELVRGHPQLAGRLSLKFTVKNGRVTEATISDSTLDDPALERCVLEAAAGWQFPASEAPITVTYPLVFAPAR